jgi:hypothetical protein
MIARMEELAVAFGHKVMHVGVDPVDNPRALALYERLGYVPIDAPQQKKAIFYDEAGNATEEEYWNINLRKQLG